MQARIWNNSTWISECDPDKLKKYFEETLGECGFKILQYIEYKVTPQGFTAIWLLGESHFAIHTFPEFGKTYIELSSCNEDYYIKYIQKTHNLR